MFKVTNGRERLWKIKRNTLGSIHWWYKIKQTPSCLLFKLHQCFQSCSCQLMSDRFFITTSSRYIAELVFILIHVSGLVLNVSPMLTLPLAQLLPSISSWDRKIMTSTVFCLLFYRWALHTEHVGFPHSWNAEVSSLKSGSELHIGQPVF